MAESQASAVEEVKVTSEDVSEWTENLGAVILVQRARVRSLTAKPLMAETEKRKLESLESLLDPAVFRRVWTGVQQVKMFLTKVLDIQ